MDPWEFARVATFIAAALGVWVAASGYRKRHPDSELSPLTETPWFPIAIVGVTSGLIVYC